MIAFRLGSLGPALLLAACSSSMHVRKVEPDDYDTPGLRYSLPKPFIKVTPASDGSVAVEVECLPDLSHTYAIDAQTTLGTHTLDVQVARGLLTSVTFKGDTTAVAKQAVSSAATVTESLLTAEAEREKARKDERKADAKAEEGKIAELQTAVDDAFLDVRKAEARLAALRATGSSPDSIRSAEVELGVAQATLAVAQARLDAARAAKVAGGGTGPSPAPGPAAASQAAPATSSKCNSLSVAPNPCEYHGPLTGGCLLCTSPGPVLYAIDEFAPCGKTVGLSLRAVRGPDGLEQTCFRTGLAPEKPKVQQQLPDLAIETPDGTDLVYPAAGRIYAAKERQRLAQDRLDDLLAELKNNPVLVAESDVQAQQLVLTDAKIALKEAEKPKFVVVTNRPVCGIAKATLEAVVGTKPPAAAVQNVVLLGPATIRFELASHTPAGLYRVDFELSVKEAVLADCVPAPKASIRIHVKSDVP